MIRFALIGDLHYPVLETETAHFKQLRQRFFKQFMREFLSIPADVHVSIGDLTHHGKSQELQDMYQTIKETPAHFKHILGNHDLYTLTKQEVEEITGQRRFQSFPTEEGLVLMLDSTRQQRPDDWSGEIDHEQLQWLQQLLQENQEEPLIIFAHHPLFNTTARSGGFNGSISQEDPIHQLLANHDPGGFYFCGHCHVHSIHEQDQWKYIQTAAVYDHPAVRIASIENKKLDTKIYEFTHPLLKEDAKTIHHYVYTQETPFNPFGDQNDRSRSLVLS